MTNKCPTLTFLLPFIEITLNDHFQKDIFKIVTKTTALDKALVINYCQV